MKPAVLFPLLFAAVNGHGWLTFPTSRNYESIGTVYNGEEFTQGAAVALLSHVAHELETIDYNLQWPQYNPSFHPGTSHALSPCGEVRPSACTCPCFRLVMPQLLVFFFHVLCHSSKDRCNSKKARLASFTIFAMIRGMFQKLPSFMRASLLTWNTRSLGTTWASCLTGSAPMKMKRKSASRAMSSLARKTRRSRGFQSGPARKQQRDSKLRIECGFRYAIIYPCACEEISTCRKYKCLAALRH